MCSVNLFLKNDHLYFLQELCSIHFFVAVAAFDAASPQVASPTREENCRRDFGLPRNSSQ